MRTTASIGRRLVTTAFVVVTGAGLALLVEIALAQSCCSGTAPAAATSGASATTGGDANPAHPQTTCPIEGGKINKAIFADYQGKRVYFCCAGCPEEFKKDPAKYVKKLEDDGITLDKAPATQGPQPSGVLKDGVRQVDYDAFRFGFSPDPLIVRAGERVRLQVTSRDVPHGIMIAGISINAAVSPGPRKAIEFTAPAKPGKYPIECSLFCGIGHGGMKGSLEVLPAKYVKAMEAKGIVLDRTPEPPPSGSQSK